MDDILSALKLGRYERDARLAPALLVLLPALMLVAVWTPNFATIFGGLVAVAFFSGSYLLMGLAREKGLEVEARLQGTLGAWPAVIALRHGGSVLNGPTRQRYHDILRRLGFIIPTAEEQQADAHGADDIYASAVQRLLELTRGERFPMLLDENISYGFRRNLRGLKPLALSVLLLCLALNCAALFLSLSSNHTTIAAAAGVAALYLVLLLVWVTVINDRFVISASWKYAQRLLACCEYLDPANPIAGSKR